MREFTKSLMSYTIATSLFGAQQVLNILRPSKRRRHPATEAFDNATKCTVEETGETARAVFRAGDNLQRGMVDLLFSVLTLGRANRDGGGRGERGEEGDFGARASGGFRDASRAAGQTVADVGARAASVFNQGARAVGQTANIFGQAVGGGPRARDGWSDAGPSDSDWDAPSPKG